MDNNATNPPKDPAAGKAGETFLHVAQFLSGYTVFRLWCDDRPNQGATTIGLPKRSKRAANKLAREIAAQTGEEVRL